MERENQRIALTKRLLKESLLQLLTEKALDKINVTELCRHAGINRATFYRHYAIPRDVLAEIEKELFQDLRGVIQLPQTQEAVRSGLGKLCSYMEQHIGLLRVIIRCNSDTDIVDLINELYMEIWHDVRALKALKELDPGNVKLLALYCAGGSYYLLRRWLMGDIRMSAEQMAAYLYELLHNTDWVALAARLERISLK